MLYILKKQETHQEMR